MAWGGMVLKFAAAMLFSMVAGSVFGIWRGYDPTTYSAATFLEMHQGAVRGVNTLLPGMASVAILLTAALAWMNRDRGGGFWLYAGALVLMVGGGVVTRLVNQPINAQIAGWTVESLPADWEAFRARWWNWHLARTGFSIAALALLLAAIVSDRSLMR